MYFAPAVLTSQVQVTLRSPKNRVESCAGQYWWHFTLPRSTTIVSMMMRGDSCCQKSKQMLDRGLCVAMHLDMGRVRCVHRR